MKPEALIIAAVTLANVLITLAVIALVEPRLLGRPLDLTIVKSDERVAPFFDAFLPPAEGDSLTLQVPDPITIVRNRPLYPARKDAGPHDVLGFRNLAVPAAASVVMIGDSQTYGMGVTIAEAWPQQLARELPRGKIAYSMAAGGWGALQYLEMLKLALAFKPRHAVIAFYAGNDASETFRAAYSVERFSRYRAAGGLSIEDHPHYPFPPPKEDSWTVNLAGRGEVTFTPRLRLVSVDDRNPAMRTGYEIMQAVLADMAAIARSSSLEMLVLLIPTKELVYRPALEAQSGIAGLREDYRILTDLEMQGRERFTSWCGEHSEVAYIEVLPELQAGVLGEPSPYPSSWDGHPSPEGHAIIARVVKRRLIDSPR